MTNSPTDPQSRLLQHYLSRAQKALDADNLEEAQEFFEKALGVEGNHPDRELDIRQALTEYSDRIIALNPPDWELAEQALGILSFLQLENEETRAAQRHFKLKRAQFLLDRKNDLEASFNIFADLMASAERLGVQDQLKADIARIICDYVSQRANDNQWSRLGQVFERARSVWTSDDGLHDWLEAVSKILEAADQAQAKHLQRLEKAQRSQQRFRALLYALVFIFVLTVVRYTLILIL